MNCDILDEKAQKYYFKLKNSFFTEFFGSKFNELKNNHYSHK